MSVRLLPLTGWVPSPWGWGSLIAPGLIIPLIVLVLAPHEWFLAVVVAAYIAPYTTGLGLCFAWPWFRERLRRARRSELARSLEMTFEPRVAEDEIEPFLDLPLFRFTENGTYSAAYLMRGRFDGRQVLVLDLGYLSTFPKRVNVKVSRRGLQTIALLSVGLNLPDFHLAPDLNDWDDLDPFWPSTLRLGATVLECNHSRRDPSVIRGRDEEALRRHFTAARLEHLGNLRGWTIECRDGWLLIYRFRELMTIEELPPFVRRVVDLAAVLTEPAEVGNGPEASSEQVQAGPLPAGKESREDNRLTILDRPHRQRDDAVTEDPGG